MASARAISTRRRSPPDRLIAGVWAIWRDGEFGEQAVHQRGAMRRIRFDQFGRGANILFGRHAAEDRGFLRQITDAEARAAVHRKARDVVAVQRDGAVIGADQAGDHVEDRGLSGAVRTQQSDHFAALQHAG